jgi:hypothetical protein
MVTRNTTVDRAVASAVLVAALVWALLIVFATALAADVEFGLGVQARERPLSSTPWVTVGYRQIYKRAWWSVPPAIAWAAWIVRRREAGLLHLIVYVAVLLNASLFWLLFTMFALYLQNQVFFT